MSDVAASEELSAGTADTLILGPVTTRDWAL